MASSFGGTIKLQGESEYKKALREITDNLKVLNSEMKVVTSQYDRNDKSASNLSQQNSVLTKKIDEQKEKVNILTKALEDARKETGDNSNTTKKWQVELNNAKAELNKLEKGLDDNEKEMKDFQELVAEIDGYKQELQEEFDEVKYLIKFADNTHKLIDRHKNVIGNIFKGAGLQTRSQLYAAAGR